MDQLSELCRVCLSSSKCLESLDTECERGCSLKFMLTSFCTLKMDDISVLYDNICNDCSSEILRCYNFKLQCEQNDSVLRERVQSLKYNEFCKGEAKSLAGVIDTSIVKLESDHSQHSDDDYKTNVQVKEEDWMEKDDPRTSDDDQWSPGDNHKSSGDEYTQNKVKKHRKSTLKKKEKPLKKSLKNSSTAGKRKSVVKSKCGRKKKPIPEEKAQLIDHSFKKLGYKRVFECPDCGNLCRTFSVINAHLKKIHSIVLKRVEEFDEMWEQERKARGIQESGGKGEDKDVKKFDPKNPMYKCIECPHRSKEFEAMKRHIVEQHREPKYIRCSEKGCQFRTRELNCLVRHSDSMHKNNHRFSCEKCDFKTLSQYHMDLHHTIKHLNISPFVCHLCAKGFSNKQNLKYHIEMKHERKLKHFCPTCTKGFYSINYLRVHMKVHSGLKPHICEHCGKAFSQKRNLEKHVFITHTGSQENNVPCPECSFKAKNIYSLHSHMKKHKERTKFYCDYCGKSFFSKYALKRHIWKHVGWVPYNCPTCSYSCDSNSRLQTHMMKHTGERPFRCQICDFGTVTKKQLNGHIETHMNQHKYKCQFCPYSANRKDILRAHLRTKCGTLTRKYTPSKSKTGIDFTHLSMSHLLAEDSGPSTSVPMDITHMKMAR